MRGDFFTHNGQYDLIIEQTFFCAIDPALRKNYVQKMADLLAPGGTLTGVLFNKHFDFEGPPFGGSKQEYENLFSPFFDIKILETNNHSSPKRKGKELFFNFKKKSG